VIPIDEAGALQEAFNMRLEELAVLDMQFLAGCARPTIAVLYEDTKHARHIKTYEVSAKDKVGAWARWCGRVVVGVGVCRCVRVGGGEGAGAGVELSGGEREGRRLAQLAWCCGQGLAALLLPPRRTWWRGRGRSRTWTPAPPSSCPCPSRWAAPWCWASQ
jgi:hypothetical protein